MDYVYVSETGKGSEGVISCDFTPDNINIKYTHKDCSFTYDNLKRFSGQEYSLALTRQELIGKIFDIYFGEQPDIRVWLNEVFCYAARGVTTQGYSVCHKKIGRIAFEETGECRLIIGTRLKCGEVFGAEKQNVLEGENVWRFVRDQVEFLKLKSDKFILKQELLKNIDIYDSIAYLEAQIDVLMDIIIKADIIPTSQLSEYNNFLEAANKNSVLTVKSKEMLKKEIEHKSLIRKLQKSYYKDREVKNSII